MKTGEERGTGHQTLRHFFMQSHLPVILFITVISAVRLLTIDHFGLGVDEAHYVLYGLYPDLSYFDHPPLVGWTEMAFTALFGISEFGARVPAVLIGAATSLLLYAWMVRLFASRPIAFWGTVAFNASFVFNALFMMLMPDTLLCLLIIPVMAVALRLEEQETLGDWMALGLLLGLAGLSKYTAFLFVAALVLYFALRRRRDLFLSFRMIPALLIAAAIVSPVLLWNMQHDWISFAFQSAHVTGSEHIKWGAFAASVGAQFGAYSPLLAPLAFYGLYRALKAPNDPALFMTGLFGAVLIAFFTYNSLYAKALPHWTALFYLLFIPIGTAFLMQKGARGRRYAYAAVGVSMLITLTLYAELRFKFLPMPDYRSIHRDLYGWDTIMEHAAVQLGDRDREAVAVTNWSLASRAIYYGRPYKINVYLIDSRFDQFDLWQQGLPAGEDLLFITTHDFRTDINATMRCDAVAVADTFDLTLGDRKVNTVTLTWCRNYQGKR